MLGKGFNPQFTSNNQTQAYAVCCRLSTTHVLNNKRQLRIILLVALEFEMEYETGFLVIAALLSFSDLMLLSTSELNKKRRIRYGLYAVILVFALIALSYVMFLQAFIGNNFSFIEVYSYSSSSLPLMSKVYASWGGARGSMLFLTLILSAFYLALRFYAHKKTGRFNVTATKVFSIIVIVFIVI